MSESLRDNRPNNLSARRWMLVGLFGASVLYIANGFVSVNQRNQDNRLTDCLQDSQVVEVNVNDIKLTRPNKAEVLLVDVDGANDIAVAVADERLDKSADNTYIFPMPFNVVMNERGKTMVEVAAQALHAKVIGVELPGVGVSDEAGASWAQDQDMALGSFDEAARIMKDAAIVGGLGVVG